MSLLGNVKDKIDRLVARTRDEWWAHADKAEEDTQSDRAVAGTRAKRDDEDGTYVGRTNPQYDAETQESGAEARAEAERQSDQ